MSVVGGEMTLPDRIKYIQGQMRIAIQNHQVLWQRLIHAPQYTEVENMLRMFQSIILSLGRRQAEMMYQYKRDLRQKYPGDKEMQNKISAVQLGWPDRDEPIKKHVPNGSSADPGKKPTAQIVKRNYSNIQLGRPSQKMTSLLKPPIGNANQQLQRKESERLKAAAAKQAETAASTKKFAPGQKPKIVLKVDPSTRRTSNEKLSDSDSFPELKESELAGYKLSPRDRATDVGELSQEQYLEFFGLVHKDKSKAIVVNQRKRKRRTAAGQSDFYKDYFQPKRPYNRKTLMADTESPSSSREITEVDRTEFSPPSEKPSVPPSPASSCSTELLEESTPREGSPRVEAAESLGKTGSQSEEVAKFEGTGDVPDKTVKGGESAAEESLFPPIEKPMLAAVESLVIAGEEPLLANEESSLEDAAAATAAEVPLAAASVAAAVFQPAVVPATADEVSLPPAATDDTVAEGFAVEEPLGFAEIPVSANLCAAEESPLAYGSLLDESTPSTSQVQDFGCKEASSESDKTPCSAPYSPSAPDENTASASEMQDSACNETLRESGETPCSAPNSPSASGLLPDENTASTSESQDSACKEASPESGEAPCSAPDSPATGEPLCDENTASTSESQESASKQASPTCGETPCSAPYSDILKGELDEAPKVDDNDEGITPQDESAPPSPTNEDDEYGDFSLSPSDLIEMETYKIPSAVDPPGKIESVSSVGEESIGEAGVDISAMIGENVQYFSADGADCLEMVKRYRLEGQSDVSEDDEDDASAE